MRRELGSTWAHMLPMTLLGFKIYDVFSPLAPYLSEYAVKSVDINQEQLARIVFKF